MVLVTHGVELSTGTWWLRNPLMSQRERMPNLTFGAGGARAKWSLALACHPCFQLVLRSCSGTLAKISPFSSFLESFLGSCNERTQNLCGTPGASQNKRGLSVMATTNWSIMLWAMTSISCSSLDSSCQRSTFPIG
jgi:hypothetical protein